MQASEVDVPKDGERPLDPRTAGERNSSVNDEMGDVAIVLGRGREPGKEGREGGEERKGVVEWRRGRLPSRVRVRLAKNREFDRL